MRLYGADLRRCWFLYGVLYGQFLLWYISDLLLCLFLYGLYGLRLLYIRDTRKYAFTGIRNAYPLPRECYTATSANVAPRP